MPKIHITVSESYNEIKSVSKSHSSISHETIRHAVVRIIHFSTSAYAIMSFDNRKPPLPRNHIDHSLHCS